MMNRKMLCGALVAGTCTWASANAQSSVQLYGQIDLGVTHFSGIAPANAAAGNRATVSSTGLSSGVEDGSRLGVKGTEDLGEGENVFFDAETGFCAAGVNQGAGVGSPSNPTNYCTGGGFMQRQAFVGMSGRYGTLQAGRMYTLQFINEAALVDPFGWGMTGAGANLSLLTQEPGLARSNETVQYLTPTMGGFQEALSYSFAPGDGGSIPSATEAQSKVPRSWDLNLQYERGSFTGGLNAGESSNLTVNPVTQVDDGALRIWQLFGIYDFKVAKLSGIYNQGKLDYSTGKIDSWIVGLTVPAGAGSVLASYEATKNTTLAAGPSARQIAFGYDYALSKQTDLYASYARISNSNGASFGGGDSTDFFSGVANQAATGMAVGIRHQF